MPTRIVKIRNRETGKIIKIRREVPSINDGEKRNPRHLALAQKLKT